MTSTTALKHLTNPKFGKAPEKQNLLLQRLGSPHTTSFNYMVDVGLIEAVADLFPVEFEMPNNDKVMLKIDEATLGYPTVPSGVVGVRNQDVYPIECRQRASTYKGRFNIRISWSVNGIQQVSFDKEMGDIPIMLKSNRCHLNTMSPEQLVEHGEHEQEWGGYFVVKGMERLVRMLLLTRRNYPIAIKRSGWKGRGTLFSEFGVMIRSVKTDHTSVNNVLHFVTDGSAKLMFSYRRALYFAPLILIMKALGKHVDYYIHRILTEGCEDDQYYIDSVENMLRNLHEEGLHTTDDCKEFLGKMFRSKFYELPEWYSNTEVADFILKRCILIHLDDPEDKFFLLAFMTKKLFAFAQNKCATEGADAVMMQELLLGGHLYLKVLKEKLQVWLLALKADLLKRARLKPTFSLNLAEVQTSAKYAGKFDNAIEMFLATGNLHRNSSGLGLMQDKGLTIVPENINRMRYMSHFKAVHRGTFFQTMRTTEARQLLPDAWGFICPVHTPDGAPCGLLNHLTMDCTVTDSPNPKLVEDLPRILKELGMLTLGDVWLFAPKIRECYTTMVDGKVVGHVPETIARDLVDKLRLLKVEGEKVPFTMEIVLVPKKKSSGQFAGLFLFTGAARMMRPVVNLMTNSIELIGTFEQVYLHVCVKPEEAYDGVTTHMELSSMAIMSNLAQLIPMPDCNQSPRNMYQCQMGKQTMGTACHNYDLQADTKLYRLQTPTAPLFKTKHYDDIDLDDFAMGTNAIVAVISYTGYDMEDAIVINKCSAERGFAYGSIYKSEFIQLEDSLSYFCRDPTNADLAELLDTDGLPFVGRPIKYDEPLYCYFNYDESRYSVRKFKGKEDCFVNSVRLCGEYSANSAKVACITFRVPRAPSVGDKFASRAGQKGICSQQWLAEDLPFTETGVVPDILFNPHGFPSRMTIAMMIEIMAGKSAAIHGVSHDATPFKFDEDDTAIDYFGRCLTMGGYNYYGTETMYSGIDGRMMEAQIFTGVVHYQRLRHMVADKWQVRSTGPMDVVTRQPVKGRKRGGGVRFGEMERDSLISHGASFLLQDRLLNCSDKCTMFICTKCKSLIGPVTVVTRMADKAYLTETKEHCRLCGNGDNVGEISIPYIFKFFVTQLASVNINTKLECKFA